MKTILIYFILLLVALLSAIDEQYLSPEFTTIKENNELVVAMINLERFPFIYESDGVLKGYDIDLANAIANELGVKLKILRTATTFDGIVSLVASGKADLGISLLSRTLERAMKVSFSDPYIVMHPMLLFNYSKKEFFSAKSGFKRLNYLSKNSPKKIRIGEVTGNSYLDIAQTIFPDIEIVEYPDWNSVFDAVIKGDILATVYHEIGVLNYSKKNPELAIYLKTESIDKFLDPTAIAIPKDNYMMKQWINLFLEEKNWKISTQDLLKRYKR